MTTPTIDPTIQLMVKAFVDGYPVETPVANINEAQPLYNAYVKNPDCDAAYIYQGDRIIQSWSTSYPGRLTGDDEEDYTY